MDLRSESQVSARRGGAGGVREEWVVERVCLESGGPRSVTCGPWEAPPSDRKASTAALRGRGARCVSSAT
eukprot:scaffold7863_cov277-Pinguiococcus_pyrenoidosus.AAC.3